MKPRAALPGAALGAILVGAFVLRAWLAWTSPSSISPDEIFQTVEQAYRLLHGLGVVPWEFRDGIRSWLLPGALAGVMAAAERLADDPRAPIFAVVVVLAALSLAVSVSAYALARERVSSGLAVVAAALCAVWADLVVFGPKALSEAVAAHALVPGLALAQTAKERPDSRRLAAAGALLGLAFALRLHLAPAVALGAFWACRLRRERWTAFAAGFAAVAALAGLVDAVTWGVPFSSLWRNFAVNLLEGKSQKYGVSPWHAYLGSLVTVWGWGTLVVLPLLAFGARRTPLLALAAGAILASHSLIAHKEHRFIYPAIALVVVLAAVGAAGVLDRLRPRPRIAAVALTLAVWSALSIRSGQRLDSGRVLVFPPPRTTTPLWAVRRGPLLAFRHLSTGPAPCGVGLVDVFWWETGGASWLGHSVPLYPHAGRRLEPAYDVAVTRASAPRPGYRREACFDGVCVDRRPGSCAPEPAAMVNEVLRRRGE